MIGIADWGISGLRMGSSGIMGALTVPIEMMIFYDTLIKNS